MKCCEHSVMQLGPALDYTLPLQRLHHHPLFFTSSRRPSETLQPKLFGNTCLKLEHPVALQRYASLPRKFRERVHRFTSRPCPACDSNLVSECQHQHGRISVVLGQSLGILKQTNRPRHTYLTETSLFCSDQPHTLQFLCVKVVSKQCDALRQMQKKRKAVPYQIIIMKRGSSWDGIPRVTGHLSTIFTSQTVGCQWWGGFTEKLRVLPRSDPNIIPHGSGHKSGGTVELSEIFCKNKLSIGVAVFRDNLREQRASCQTFILPILRWLVKLRNGVESARLQGGAERVQNKQDKQTIREPPNAINTVVV